MSRQRSHRQAARQARIDAVTIESTTFLGPTRIAPMAQFLPVVPIVSVLREILGGSGSYTISFYSLPVPNS